MHISLQIIIAALSVLGLYFCLKTLASLIFTSNLICAAIIINSKDQLAELDVLLPETASALFATKRKRTAVIVPEGVWSSCGIAEKDLARELTDRFGAELYLIGTDTQ